MSNNLSIGDVFHLERRKQKMTVIDLAEKSGINRNTISAIERNENLDGTRIDTIYAIAKALGLGIEIDFKRNAVYHDEQEAQK